jgi:hypothetical protein
MPFAAQRQNVRFRIKNARETLRQTGRAHEINERPQIIGEERAVTDRLIVDAAAVGSIYLMQNGLIHFKLDTGWYDLRAARERLDLGALDDEVLDLLDQVAERELLSWERFTEAVRHRRTSYERPPSERIAAHSAP